MTNGCPPGSPQHRSVGTRPHASPASPVRRSVPANLRRRRWPACGPGQGLPATPRVAAVCHLAVGKQ
eukprot:9858032-Alexandrium_andersonii.AAC.1